MSIEEPADLRDRADPERDRRDGTKEEAAARRASVQEIREREEAARARWLRAANRNRRDELLTVLKKLTVLNRDDGRTFTDTGRLDAIASLLRGSAYRRIEAKGLFHLYSRKPPEELRGPVLVVSSHADCERHITKCFAEERGDGTLAGTFDNAITNAAAVFLMRSGRLPDRVLVAFTGDEEENGRGAKDLSRFIQGHSLDVRNVFVLDVTGEGWKTGADFTVENDFWYDDFGKRVVGLAVKTGYPWNYVPGDCDDIPAYIPKERIVRVEAFADESWEYSAAGLPCFSLCLPTKGKMHHNDGILVRTASFLRYTRVLEKLLDLR